MSYDVITKIEIVHERPAEFPAITICVLNLFETPQARLLLNEIASDYNLNPQNESVKITFLAQMKAASTDYDEEQKRHLNFDFEHNLETCFFGTSNCKSSLTWYV